MAGSNRRLWGIGSNVYQSQKIGLDFLKRCRDKNILFESHPIPYQVWKVVGDIESENYPDFSEWIRFSASDSRKKDEERIRLIRLFSACLKAHYFLLESWTVKEDPKVFMIPNISNPSQNILGMLYSVEDQGKTQTFIVSESDIGYIATPIPKQPTLVRFPTIIGKSSYGWLEINRWKELKKTSAAYPWYQWNTWQERKKITDQMHAITDKDAFVYGTPMDFTSDQMREEMIYLGAEWARGIKKYFYPIGWDLPLIAEYFQYWNTLTNLERYSIRWLKKLPPPAKP